MGLPRLTPHGFRHTAATLLIDRGVSPKTIQQILGHSSIQITLDLYVHLADEIRTVADAMEDALGGAISGNGARLVHFDGTGDGVTASRSDGR